MQFTVSFFAFTGSKGIEASKTITPFVVIIFLVRQLYLKEIIKVGVEYVICNQNSVSIMYYNYSENVLYLRFYLKEQKIYSFSVFLI
jgi:hypothetical protein